MSLTCPQEHYSLQFFSDSIYIGSPECKYEDKQSVMWAPAEYLSPAEPTPPDMSDSERGNKYFPQLPHEPALANRTDASLDSSDFDLPSLNSSGDRFIAVIASVAR